MSLCLWRPHTLACCVIPGCQRNQPSETVGKPQSAVTALSKLCGSFKSHISSLLGGKQHKWEPIAKQLTREKKASGNSLTPSVTWVHLVVSVLVVVAVVVVVVLVLALLHLANDAAALLKVTKLFGETTLWRPDSHMTRETNNKLTLHNG